jgi:hypothetical protein
MGRYAQPTNVEEAVRMADRLSALLGRLGVPLSQARALDLVARICGLPDWDRMRAGLVRLEGAQVPMADHALTRLLRLDAERSEHTVRAVEAVWFAHLTDPELADPGLPGARVWLRAAAEAAHAWARAHRTPLTPDHLAACLEAGTGAGYRAHRARPSPLLPTLLDLQAWALGDRVSAPWADRLAACLAGVPGYDPAIPLSGAPLPEAFRRAAGERMRLTMRPVRDLIDEVRMETGPDPLRIG